jgi:putative ABC transport system permease protein
MRIRHRLMLDEPNDFDFMTQDIILNVYGKVTQAVFLALVVISSIALMVGGIGVMAIMMISLATGFPISLPWWSFAMRLGFSAAVGIFFGMVPAIRASKLDPIEALRYE